MELPSRFRAFVSLFVFSLLSLVCLLPIRGSWDKLRAGKSSISTHEEQLGTFAYPALLVSAGVEGPMVEGRRFVDHFRQSFFAMDDEGYGFIVSALIVNSNLE